MLSPLLLLSKWITSNIQRGPRQRSVDKREGKKAETLLNYARLKRVE